MKSTLRRSQSKSFGNGLRLHEDLLANDWRLFCLTLFFLK